MQTLIFATNNQHKVDEIKLVLNNSVTIITLQEAGIHFDIEEPYNNLKDNALEKARVIYNFTNKNCFGEDTGLEVAALHGEPGVKSARYAGEERDFEKNIDKLLFHLKNEPNRNACFRTVMALIINGKHCFFEGICDGFITTNRKGSNGFGYDAVFIPKGGDRTFAELNMIEKSKYSHRKKALDKLISFLNNHFKN